MLYAVGATGFVAAIGIGSIAWYNSKKPAGWESAESPSWANQNWAQAAGEQGADPGEATVKSLERAPRVQ